jgi:hypothetical protein
MLDKFGIYPEKTFNKEMIEAMNTVAAARRSET